MSISSIDAAANVLSGLHANGAGALGESNSTAFKDFLTQAIDAAETTSADSTAFHDALLMGELNNLHAAPIAAREAELAISLTVAIRDRLVEAYQEIMRMQV